MSCTDFDADRPRLILIARSSISAESINTSVKTFNPMPLLNVCWHSKDSTFRKHAGCRWIRDRWATSPPRLTPKVRWDRLRLRLDPDRLSGIGNRWIGIVHTSSLKWRFPFQRATKVTVTIKIKHLSYFITMYLAGVIIKLVCTAKLLRSKRNKMPATLELISNNVLLRLPPSPLSPVPQAKFH